MINFITIIVRDFIFFFELIHLWAKFFIHVVDAYSILGKVNFFRVLNLVSVVGSTIDGK